jgi:hypothetical protein
LVVGLIIVLIWKRDRRNFYWYELFIRH